MTRAGRLSVVLISSLLACHAGLGTAQAALRQSQTPADSGGIHDGAVESPAVSMGDIPAVRAAFEPKTAIGGIEASSAILAPILCSPDGVAFVAVLNPPSYRANAVRSLDPGKSQVFSIDSVPGLYDMSFLGFFPGASIVGLLVDATADSTQSQYSLESPAGVTVGSGRGFRGEHHEYLAEFGRDGTFKTTVELPREISFHRVGELPDGNIVAIGYDRTNRVARLLLLDSAGQLLRPLQIPAKMQDSAELRSGEVGGILSRGRAETSVSWWLLAPVGGNLLLYVARSKYPILEIRSGGGTREVQVQMPPGYLLDGIVSANDRWIVRYRKENFPERGEVSRRDETGNYVFYEINPADGALMTRLELASSPGLGIACEKDGELFGFSVTQDSKYLLWKAAIPR